jgi:hypothetical protein
MGGGLAETIASVATGQSSGAMDRDRSPEMRSTTLQLARSSVRRLSALAHTADDDETVLGALRHELQYVLAVDEVRLGERSDHVGHQVPLIVDTRPRGVVGMIMQHRRELTAVEA